MTDTLLQTLTRLADRIEAGALQRRLADRTEVVVAPQPQRRPPLLEAPTEIQFPSKFVKVCGLQLHYYDAGPPGGPPVVFIHGNPSSAYLWRNIIPYLSERMRCVAVDLAGMGESEKIPGAEKAPLRYYSFFDHARYVDGFIRELGLRDILLVLHDWGTALGFDYMARNPDNVSGLAFMEALFQPYPSWNDFPRPGAPPDLGRFFASLRGQSGFQALVEQPMFFYQSMIAPLTGRPLSREEESVYARPAASKEARIPIWRWVNQLPVAGDPAGVARAVERYAAAIGRSDLPKLLIYHPMGVITTDHEADWARQNWKNNLEVVKLEGNAPGPVHFLQEAFPDKIGPALRDWAFVLR